LLLVLLVPLALHAGVAAVTTQQYFSGAVRVPGYPANKKFGVEARNLDPVYRVACDLEEYSWVTPTRWRTLELLVRWFGPVPGSYQGPYPDRETAWAFVRSAQRSVAPAALSQPLVVDGQAIRLSAVDIQRALPPEEALDDSNARVALKMFEGTCLLIGHWSGVNYCVELIDTGGLGWFARYVFAPDD